MNFILGARTRPHKIISAQNFAKNFVMNFLFNNFDVVKFRFAEICLIVSGPGLVALNQETKISLP